jgi:hypothetical protein
MTTIELEHALEAEEALNEDLKNYTGQWVAVAGARVVAHAKTLGELLEQVEGKEVELLEVPDGDCTVSFF